MGRRVSFTLRTAAIRFFYGSGTFFEFIVSPIFGENRKYRISTTALAKAKFRSDLTKSCKIKKNGFLQSQSREVFAAVGM